VMRALSWTLGVDPMMRKEFYGVSRRWQTYFFRALYVAILGFVIWLVWLNLSDGLSYSQYAQFGRFTFILFSVFQFFLLMLGGLAAGSDMISKEVRAGTLAILAITPLSGWRIVLGKAKACFAQLLITILSGVPVLSLGIYLGGAEAGDLVRVTTLTLGAVALGVGFGILCSTGPRNSYVTLTMAVLGMVAYCLLPLLVGAILNEMRVFDFEEVISFFAWFVHAVSFVLGIEPRGVSTSLLEFGWISSTLFSFLLALCCMALAAARVRKLARVDRRPPLLKRLFESMDRAYQRMPLGITVWAESATVWDWNPYLWKELRARVTGKFRYFTRIMLVLLVVFALFTAFMAPTLLDRDVVVVVLFVLTMLLFLVAIGSGAGSFTKEKEEHQWDILLTTPIRVGRLVGAKLAGAVVGATHLLVMLALFGVLVSVFHDPYRDPHVISTATCTLAFAFFTICVGMLLSLTVSSTKRAYALTLAVVVFLLVVLPIMLAIHVELTRQSGQLVRDVLWSTNPFYHIVEATGSSPWRRFHDEAWGGAVAHALIYVPLGLVCLAVCSSRFHRLAGRVR